MRGHTFEEFPREFTDEGLHGFIVLTLMGEGDDGREERGDND